MAHVLDQIQDLANESDRFKNKHINATDVAIRIYLEFPVATSARLEASCNNGVSMESGAMLMYRMADPRMKQFLTLSWKSKATIK